MDRYGTQPRIPVEVSDRRLPIRMMAGRIRNDVRHPASTVQSRIQRLPRPSVMMTAALMLPIIGVSRARQLAR